MLFWYVADLNSNGFLVAMDGKLLSEADARRADRMLTTCSIAAPSINPQPWDSKRKLYGIAGYVRLTDQDEAQRHRVAFFYVDCRDISFDLQLFWRTFDLLKTAPLTATVKTDLSKSILLKKWTPRVGLTLLGCVMVYSIVRSVLGEPLFN